jgi:streptogramin lyase
MPLNPSGSAFEVNRDAQGRLYVSDYNAGEIWLLDPVKRLFTRYSGFSLPGDARSDGGFDLAHQCQQGTFGPAR